MDSQLIESRTYASRMKLFGMKYKQQELIQLKDAQVKRHPNGLILDCQEVQNLVNIDEIIYNSNKIDQIILPSYLEEFNSVQEKPASGDKKCSFTQLLGDKECTIINSFIFTSYKVIHTIIIKFQQNIVLFQSKDQIQQINRYYRDNYIQQSIDLSNFVSLKILKLGKVQKNLILPNQLEELEIEGQIIRQPYLLNFPDSLIKCKINSFQIQKLDILQLQKCELQNCIINLLTVGNMKQYEMILNKNTVDNLILPSYLEEFLAIQQKSNRNDKLGTIRNNFIITSYQVIHTIVIQFEVEIMLSYSKCNDKKQYIDLSNFISLKILKLSIIYSDIILPNSLKELEICGPDQSLCDIRYKILNLPENLIICKIINFQIKEINTSKLEKCNLQNCKISNLILYNSQQQKQLLNGNLIDNIQFNFNCEEVNYTENDINNIIFCNRNILKLKVQKLNLIHVNTEKLQKTSLANDQNNNLKIIDLSQFNLLQAIEINTQYIQILFPIQIKQIRIQKLLSEIKIFNLSQFDLLQMLEIQNHHIEFIILPKQNKKKFTLSFIPQVNNSIYIETFQTTEYNSFVDNVQTIKIKGLVNINYSKISDQNNLDFDIFSHLKILQIENIIKQIQLPKSIVELSARDTKDLSHTNKFQFNLDLQMYKNVIKVELQNCKVDNIIGNFQLFLKDCEVNLVKTYKQKTIESTKIKIYEQTINLKYIGVNKTNRFQTISIKQPENISSVTLYGIKNIVFKNQNPDQNILDFTLFVNLENIFLVDINCLSIIFGKSQTTVKIYNTQQKNLNKLDFSQCKKIKQAIVNNLQIKLVVVTNQKIEFENSQIKFLKFHLVDKISFSDDYLGICQYIVLQRNKQDQRILYHKRQNVKYNHMHVILSHKIDGIYQKIIKLIKE